MTWLHQREFPISVVVLSEASPPLTRTIEMHCVNAVFIPEFNEFTVAYSLVGIGIFYYLNPGLSQPFPSMQPFNFHPFIHFFYNLSPQHTFTQT